MKKIMYMSIVIILVAVFTLLYSTTAMFNQNNIKNIYINQEVSLDKDDSMVKKLTRKLESLKQYPILNQGEFETVNTVVKKTLMVEKHFGQSSQYTISLDYDFDYIILTDHETNQHYKIKDEIVEWLYMLDDFAEIYEYSKPKFHHIQINGLEMKTIYETKWQYVKADDLWYENKIFDHNLNRIDVIDKAFSLEMLYDEMPTDSNLKIYYNDQIIYDDDAFEYTFDIVENGLYLFEIETKWQSDLKMGIQTSWFEVSCQYPPEFNVSSTQMEQGKYIVLTGMNIQEPDTLYIDQDYLEGISFQKVNDEYVCLIPATYYTTPGTYSLNYGVKGYDYTLEFEVNKRVFELQFLTVDSKTTQSTQTTEGYAQYDKYYKTALLKNVYEPTTHILKEPMFILPTTGRVTTEFGVQRYVNNKPTSYHHAGLDIANDRGTPIMATYEGEVVLAMEMIVTGNTVVINHGNGIFSSYFHMDTFEVVEGQKLETGEVIGTIGTTGFSTGPHLHFSISYYKMNLEPGYFIYGEKVTYDNYKTLFTND